MRMISNTHMSSIYCCGNNVRKLIKKMSALWGFFFYCKVATDSGLKKFPEKHSHSLNAASYAGVLDQHEVASHEAHTRACVLGLVLSHTCKYAQCTYYLHASGAVYSLIPSCNIMSHQITIHYPHSVLSNNKGLTHKQTACEHTPKAMYVIWHSHSFLFNYTWDTFIAAIHSQSPNPPCYMHLTLPNPEYPTPLCVCVGGWENSVLTGN